MPRKAGGEQRVDWRIEVSVFVDFCDLPHSPLLWLRSKQRYCLGRNVGGRMGVWAYGRMGVRTYGRVCVCMGAWVGVWGFGCLGVGCLDVGWVVLTVSEE